MRIVITMSSARPHRDVRPPGLRDDPHALRAVVALGMFSLAEHAVWVTVLVVAYQQGGVSEAGGVSAALLAPAALMAPLVAREMASPDIRNPLAAGYALQTVTLALASAVLALDLDQLFFYMASLLVTITTVFSRPAHHAFLSMRRSTVAATVATGVVSGGAQLAGPLLSAAVLTRFEIVHVFLIATALLLAATVVTIRMPHRPASLVGAALPSSATPHQVASFLRGRPAGSRRCVLLLFGLLAFVAVVLGTIETLATEVSFASNRTGGSGTGFLLASTGGGLLVGGVVAGIIVRRANERAAMRIGSVVAGIALVAAGVPLGVAWSLSAFAMVGVGMQTVLVAGWLLLHRHVCSSNAGVVFGVLESQHLIGNAGGAASAGLVMGHLGVWPALVVAAVGLPVSMLALSDDRVGRLAPASTIVGASAAAAPASTHTV